jgi:preprotein translocase subunit SecG
MQTLLLVVELLVAIALVGVVLLQRSEGGALGMGGGGSGLGGLFSPRGASDTLTRTTVILAAIFFVVCLALNLMVRFAHREASPLDSSAQSTKITEPAQKAPPKAPSPQVPITH